MSKFVGRRGSVGIAKESSAGTIVTPTFWIPVNSISFDDKTTTAREEEGLGRIEDSDSNYVVGKHSDGEIEFDLNDKQASLFISSLLGASPSTGGGPTYTHTYTLQNTNTHQSLSIAYQDPDQTKIFPYCVVNEIKIEVEPDGIAKATVSFMGRISRDWSTLTPDFTSLGNKFLHQHLVCKLASTIGGLSAASNISLKKLDITFGANSEMDNVTGTVEPEAILNHQFSVEGSITLNKESDTYRDYMIDGTYRSMEVTFNRASDSILQFQFPRVDFTEWEQDRSLNDIVGQSINFKGNYDAANALAIVSTAILTNTYDGTSY